MLGPVFWGNGSWHFLELCCGLRTFIGTICRFPWYRIISCASNWEGICCSSACCQAFGRNLLPNLHCLLLWFPCTFLMGGSLLPLNKHLLILGNQDFLAASLYADVVLIIKLSCSSHICTQRKRVCMTLFRVMYHWQILCRKLLIRFLIHPFLDFVISWVLVLSFAMKLCFTAEISLNLDCIFWH